MGSAEKKGKDVLSQRSLCTNKNVVDGDVHKLHKVADEAHDSKADCRADDCLAVLCVGSKRKR